VSTPTIDHPTAPKLAERWILLAASVGILCRVVVCLLSTGSNDIRTWERFALSIRESGLAALYQTDPLFNHPPLMGLYSAAVSGLADRFALPFPVLFKLPMVAADALVLMLLYWSVLHSDGTRKAARVAVVWAWAPASILISAFHGNTDALCAALAVSSLFLVARRKSPFAGGLLMAAALNVKLIPVLLAPSVLVLAGGRKGMTRFVAGAAVGAIPFAIAVVLGGGAVLHNLLGWAGVPDLWGVFGALRAIGYGASETLPGATAMIEGLASVTRYVLLGIVIAVPVHARRTGRRLDLRLPAFAMLLFLILAPGFGIQYMLYVAPFVLLMDLPGGAALACVSGAFVAATYGMFMVSWSPMTTLHTFPLPATAAALGGLTWLLLVALLVRMWRLPRLRDQ